MARPIPTKGLVIDEKRPREDSISSPNKKGKVVDSSKGKVATPVPEAKKTVKPTKVASSRAIPASRPGDGTSASLGTILWPRASIMSSPSVAEKILREVIPPIDKKKVEQLTLDQTSTRLFHVIDQVLPRLRSQFFL